MKLLAEQNILQSFLVAGKEFYYSLNTTGLTAGWHIWSYCLQNKVVYDILNKGNKSSSLTHTEWRYSTNTYVSWHSPQGKQLGNHFWKKHCWMISSVSSMMINHSAKKNDQNRNILYAGSQNVSFFLKWTFTKISPTPQIGHNVSKKKKNYRFYCKNECRLQVPMFFSHINLLHTDAAADTIVSTIHLLFS